MSDSGPASASQPGPFTQSIDARTAAWMGLANDVVPPGRLEQAAIAMVRAEVLALPEAAVNLLQLHERRARRPDLTGRLALLMTELEPDELQSRWRLSNEEIRTAGVVLEAAPLTQAAQDLAGRVADAVALVRLEAAVFLVLLRSRPALLTSLLLNAASGAALMMALLTALTAASAILMALWLAMSLTAHCLDLWIRLRQ